ncbi:centrosomal protein of 170 kDa protein B isoform X2 [Colossoma macropomum]|uniref:centrosomal protein of 170 kDa protein B isoform X2 n=1 Tax=Colossoma macropomum TaxID=42526 RepID=UPI001863AE9D|nr:centrosomal protein of 170 kDa protein B isoform X2 [Colossoma macropomum]
MSVTSWFLVSSSGTRHRLPREMIFVGREDCELMLQSRSVDKQHAVINYDAATDEHLVKDLGSLNGTFVNDLRIPDQTYITLKLSDVVRFGYDTHVYIMERSQHKVPEEALKHEKYTSQLQMGLKALEAKKREQAEEKSCKPTELSHSKQDKSESKSTTAAEPPASKPTPLYGQPSWWGDADEENKGQQREPNAGNQKEDSKNEVNGSTSEHQDGQPEGKPVYPYRKDAGYFEIPTKELHSRPKTAEPEVQVIPTKDTDNRTASTPPVVQSHASFTIEFDECTPGKIKIKDHVTKFSFRQRKTPSKESVFTPTEVMSAESKVADWLVQSDASMARRKSRTEDLYSTKSDLSINRTILKDGHHHEDGTQCDSEDPATKPPDVSKSDLSPPRLFTPPEREEPPASSTPHSQSQGRQEPQQAFVIEFFDDVARKKRSQSFTNNISPPESHEPLKNRMEKMKSPSQTGEKSTPSQQFTVPLKDSGGFQRAGSLRREKTDVRMSSSNFSSRSASSKAFNSVGRRSKLAQDFAAEFLRASKSISTATWEKPTSSTSSSASNTVSMVTNNSSTQSQPPVPIPIQTQVSSPSHQQVPSKSLLTPTPANCTDVKNTKGSRQEEEDSLSDAGTYTIETEGPDKEVEEARNKIDQVFGVGECPEHNSQSSAATVYRPVGRDREGQDSLPLSESSPGPVLGHYPGFSDPSMGPAQVESMVLTTGNTRWVSRWASLADNYSDSGSVSGLFDIPAQMDLSDGRIIHQTMLNRNTVSTESESGQNSRGRRILPQLPSMEKTETPPPSIHVRSDSYLNYEGMERNIRGSQQKEDLQKLYVPDDLEPDSLSDASKSDDGSIVEQGRKTSAARPEKTGPEVKSQTSSKHEALASGAAKMVKDQDSTPKFSTATITRQHGNKPNLALPNRDASQCEENPVSLIRQESFTKDRSSDDIHFTRLPHISSPSSSDDKNAFKGVCSQDTQSYLKETENVLASLEARLQVQKRDSGSCPLEDSLSGESDVDTSSTVSQRSGRNAVTSAPKKPVILSELLKERKAASQHAQEQNRFQSSGDPLSQASRSSQADNDRKGESDKCFQLRRSSGKHGSLDFGNEPQSSTIRQWPETVSDQESNSRPTQRKFTIPLQKDNSSKSTKGTVAQALARSNSLSAPRPTRTSMLRRARLGEASDNDGTETDRTSQNSDANPSTTRPQDSKKLSRLDILALPRKRAGSFTTPSDTESSAGKTGFSNRSSESGFSARKASVSDPKTGAQKGSGGLARQPIIRGRSSSAKYASSTASSRRRQKGSDYTSTSEEEYESNQSTPKHKRSHHSGALHARTQNLLPVRPISRTRDSEGEGHESDAFQSWTTHSAEIARLSQDLAKDLAILAREIHDVAGDAEPQNSASADTVEPVSAISTCEELRHQIPETSLNYPKVPPISAVVRNSDQIINDQSLKQCSWNQEQVALDNGMLNPVSQLSVAIRENTEQLTEKIKLLFHNKIKVWEEIEAKINAADDPPPLDTPNKEIMAILQDLRGIQKRLEVINRILEPSGNPDVAQSPATGGQSTAGLRSFRVSPRDWRTTSSQRGGGPSASSRRFGRGSEGESFVV